MPARVILVRHGHTELNAGPPGGAERIRGHQNVPLSSRGREQSRQIAKAVAEYPITHIISSDLDRAADTARAISRASVEKPRVSLTPLLRPWKLGAFENQLVSDVGDAVATLVAKKHTPPPGDGETFHEFTRRFLGFLTNILTRVQSRPHVLPVLVAHTRNLRLAEAWIEHGEKGVTPSVMAGKSEGVAPGDGVLLTWNGREWKMTMIAGSHAPSGTKAS